MRRTFRFRPPTRGDHRDPSNAKAFTISADGVPLAWPRLVEEAAKCDLLCANCHREVHSTEGRS